jgi:hypothetical protein
MSKHTPGPWKAEWRTGPHSDECLIGRVDEIPFCMAGIIAKGRGFSNEEVEANAERIVECVNAMEGIDYPAVARLVLDSPRVAAASDMLAALRKAVKLARLECKNPKCACIQCGVVAEMRAAIAKAEGKKP